jgi:RTX calcium-binding nonapeptide repeat (4 copies)
MKNLRNGRRPSPAALLAAAATAAAALVGGAAGIDPAQARAAQTHNAHSHQAHFERPKLTHGLLTVRGTNGSDSIALRLAADDPNVIQIDLNDDGSAEASFDRSAVTRIAVDAGRGDDRILIDDSNGAFTNSIPTTIDGGDGDDTIAGGAGAETLLGGDGNDTIDGNGGSDEAFLGAGKDTFVWDPGDGSDTIEGQSGTDTLLFNGANVAENVDLSANGSRLRFFRTQANITMDTAGVEQVIFNALDGADNVTVNDLTGTDVKNVSIDLGVGGVSDGQLDTVNVKGTDGNDGIAVTGLVDFFTGSTDSVSVTGLAAEVDVLHPDSSDQLNIDTGAGNDTVDSAGLANAIQLSVTSAGGRR